MLALWLLLAPLAPPTEPPKIAVMPPKLLASAQGAIEPAMLDEAVLAAVQAAGDFSVIGKSDMDVVLGFEKQKELMGCDDVACFADISGALGVQRLVSVQIGKTDGSWMVSAKLIDVQGGAPKVAARLLEPPFGKTASDLLRALPGLLARLLKDGGLAVRPAALTGAPSPSAPAKNDDDMARALSQRASTGTAPTQEQILAGIRQITPQARACYQHEKALNPELTSRVPVKMTFRAIGSVTSATVTGELAGSPLAACIEDAVKKIRVPQFTQATFSVSYPFVFQ